MSIAEEIARLQQAKADLKASINAKIGSGGTITNETIDEYASKVSALPSPKEEQTKTVSPTTSSQDVLPDANKVLSKVTVNAIPTETKSQQPNLSSGNQTINATSDKFMTSFTITKDTINHIVNNIREGVTLYGVLGTLKEGTQATDATAIESEVLASKTFYAGNTTKKTGTMVNSGAVNTDITTKAQEVTITQGYHSGSGKTKISATEQAKIIASNIKSGVTILGQAGGLTPAKEEETKTVTPNFSSGNVGVTPTSGKVMTQVTINKDANLIADNIKKDVTVHGITGTLESGGGYNVCIISPRNVSYNIDQGYLSYSLDNGTTWVDLTSASQLNIILSNITQISFKLTNNDRMYASLWDCSEKNDEAVVIGGQGSNWTGSNIILSENKIYEIMIQED